MGSENPELLGDPLSVLEHFRNSLGFRHLINLTLQESSYSIKGLQRHHIPVEKLPSTKQLKEINSIITEALDCNEPVWVHCQKGIDRTAAVLGSYLISIGGKKEEIILQLEEIIKRKVNYPNFAKYWEETREFIEAVI